MGPDTDLAQVERVLRGESEAFDELVQTYLPRIYRLCLSLTGQQQDAEDCTQEAFLKAYRALPNYRGSSSFYTWLYRIASNVCHDFHRARPSAGQVISLDETYGEDDQPAQYKDPGRLPDDLAISHELGNQLRTVINLLPETMRDVLVLRDVEGYSYDEIARMLHLSEGTVKSRLFRARNQVISALRREQISPADRPIQQIQAEQRRVAR